MRTGNSFSVKRVVVVISTLVLLLGVTVLAFLSWQLSLKPGERIIKGLPGVDERQAPKVTVSREAQIAQAENLATLEQQATMAASPEELVVPRSCEEMAIVDPFVGVNKYVMRSEATKLAEYTYRGVITGYREEVRGKCTDSVIEWEYVVDEKPRAFETVLPKQMLGKGALGSILPKVVGYKVGHEMEIKISYIYIPDKSLKVVDWEVVQFYIVR